MYVAAKMLLNKWSVAYCSDAMVYHSHNYTIWQEFKRYFDIGVFHSRESWIKDTFGGAEGEGKKYIISEFKYLIKRNIVLIFPMIIRDIMKFLGFRLGMKEHFINKHIKRKISMTKNF